MIDLLDNPAVPIGLCGDQIEAGDKTSDDPFGGDIFSKL
jgi:hypothetical protein